MLYRSFYIAKDEALGDSGTKVWPIDVQDPITQLWVEFRCANGAGGNKHNPMHECISAIELIDGGDVIWSLDGEQLLAKVCADLGHFPHQRFSALQGDPASLALPMQFGRFWGDKSRAFDPKRFTNPQLRVTWNLATNQAVGTGGYAASGLTATVIAEVMEGAPSPSGLIVAKEISTWTSAVGTEYISLPTDQTYRGLLFRGHLVAYHPYGIISNVKLSANGGAYIPWDIGVEDLLYQLMLRQPRLDYRIADQLANGNTFYSFLNELEDVMMQAEDTADINVAYYNWEYGSKTVVIYQNGSTYGPNVNIGVHVHGYCPFGYLYVPFGDQNEPGDWFPAPSFKRLQFEATGATASGECALALVMDRPYR